MKSQHCGLPTLVIMLSLIPILTLGKLTPAAATNAATITTNSTPVLNATNSTPVSNATNSTADNQVKPPLTTLYDSLFSDAAAEFNPSVAGVKLDLADRMSRNVANWTKELSKLSTLDIMRYQQKMSHRRFLADLLLGATGSPIMQSLFKGHISLLASFTLIFVASESERLSEIAIERFFEVNQRLNRIQETMTTIIEKLQVSRETSEALAPYRKCHNSVRNGAQRLAEILNSIKTARSRKKLALLAEEYITWYESSELDNHIMDLFDVATRETTAAVGKNIFHAYTEQYDCSTNRLIYMMFSIVHELRLGSQLQLMYLYFRKRLDRAEEQYQKARNNQYKIREVFNRYYWYCLKNTDVIAANVAKQLLEKASSRALRSLAKEIREGLESHFHRFNWAVAVGKIELDRTSTLDKGNTFQLPTEPPMLVMFSDSKQVLNCSDAKKTSTRVTFKCHPKNCDVSSSQEIVGSRTCPGLTMPGADGRDWLASVLIEAEGPCASPKSCGGHGQCHHTPAMGPPVCFCEPEYQGDRCEEMDDYRTVSASLIADLRNGVGKLVGASTTVDVYYELLDVQSNLFRELRWFKDCQDLTSLLGSDIISESMYMTSIYTQLLKGQRTQSQFGELMDTHVSGRSMDYLLTSLLDTLLGLSPFDLPIHGVVHLFKICWVKVHQQSACSDQYAKSVQRFMSNLALMDEAVGEALLTYFSWKGDRITEPDKLVLKYLANGYKNRTAQFRNRWYSQSCPALVTPEKPLGPGLATWQLRFCNASHSYEGAVLTVNCESSWKPRTNQITCIRRSDGRLAWSQEPRCDKSGS